MAQCYDSLSNTYVYCTSYSGTYIAVGVIIPLVIFFVIIIVSAYLRCKRSRLRRGQQPTTIATVVPIYNADEQQQPSHNYPYPPHYAAEMSNPYDKPPSYEQTVQQLLENNNSSGGGTAAIIPVTTTTPSSGQPAGPTRAQN